METSVLKFGGTSVEDRAAFERVAAIVAAHEGSRPVVVVSAMAGVTDALLRGAAAAARGNAAAAARSLDEHFERHLRVAGDVRGRARSGLAEAIGRARLFVSRRLEEIAARGEADPRALDAIVSYGERLSARLLAAVLEDRGMRARYVDARRCVITDEQHGNARPLKSETNEAAREMLLPVVAAGRVPVLGGFIGSTPGGVTTTLGRGGSDYTAALVGTALCSKEIQIWTDVNGVLTADPRVVKEARTVPRLSYGEAAELTYFGAKVLHPKTVQPAFEQGIPVSVRNTRVPEHPGTLVHDEADVCHARPVKAIAHRTGGASIEVSSDTLRGDRAALDAVLAVFERHATPVDLLSTTDAGVSLTVGCEAVKLNAIVRELQRLCPVEVRENLAVVCLVGEGLRHAPGVAAKVSRVLGAEGALAVSRRATDNNLTLVVREERIGDVVTRLHREFCESEHAGALFDAARENVHAPAHA